MKIIVSEAYHSYKAEISNIIHHFNSQGKTIYGGSRNTIKVVQAGDLTLNIKGFKVPNIINQLAYRFVRKSKAERSYQYANYLLKAGIGTPTPIAYAEEVGQFNFKESFYVCKHVDYDLTYRNLVREDIPIKDWEGILRAFTRFTYQLHENKVEFLDHSPGNTLIELNKDEYTFYLVDLNRMNFKELSLDERIKNFAKLTPRKDMVAIMSNEYARLLGVNEQEVFEKMWKYTSEFQDKYHRKRRMKKKLKALIGK